MAEKTSLNDEFEKFETMTNVELRSELKRRGYSTTGNKKDLLAKLKTAVEKEENSIDSTETSTIKYEKQPLLETNLTAANVMNFENDDEKEKLDDQTTDEPKIEEKSSIDELNSTPVQRQNEFSSTNNKENIQKREMNDDDKSTIIYKKLKRNDFTSQPSSSTFLKGFSRSNNTRVNLSLNLLQTLIPDVTLSSMTNEDLDRHIHETFDSHHSTTIEPMTIGDLVDQTEQRSRTVVLDRIVTSDEPIRVKDVARINGKSTRFIHITGLTRPFTIFQLRELLQRYGSMTDEQIWLDKVKSQCLVMYKTIDEAEEARQSLDGCRWPTTNPKSMSIRFARQDEFDFCKSKDLPPDQMTLDRFTNERAVETSDQHVSGFLINEDETTIENPNETAKTLDDFFRKTDAKPCVYWLPLTEDEVIERDQRKAERRDRPTTFEDKTNSDHRRHRHRRHSSSSSREKHKQQRSPLAKRDAKRH